MKEAEERERKRMEKKEDTIQKWRTGAEKEAEEEDRRAAVAAGKKAFVERSKQRAKEREAEQEKE